MSTKEQPGVAFGQRSTIQVRATGRDDLIPPTYSGGVEAVGGSYLFHFPFDILVADGLSELQTSMVDNTWIDIYPPFFNGSELVSPAQIELEVIPWKPGTLRPDFDRVRVKELVVDRHLGKRANALRIDFRPDRGSDFASRIVEQFVGLTRWWTGQWWIGRDRRAEFLYLRNWFPINERGERLSGIDGFASIYGNFGIERAFNSQHFRNIRGNITNGRLIPLSIDTFFDAIHFHATGQLRRAVLEAAIACEARIGEEATRICARAGLPKSRLKKALSSDDFTVKLIKGMGQLTQRSFARDHPESYKWLQLIRTARGQIAHGGSPLIPAANGSRAPTSDEVFQMLRSAHAMFQWLEKL